MDASFGSDSLDPYPQRTTKLKTHSGEDVGEFRSNGSQSIVWGIHPKTKEPYQFVVRQPVIEIDYNSIQWPDEIARFPRPGHCAEDPPLVEKSCTQSTHTVGDVSSVASGSSGSSVASVSSVYTIAEAVQIALPHGTHENHRLLYKLAGALSAYQENMGRPVTNPELQGALDQWYALARPFLNGEQTRDEYYLEFMDAWRNVDHPLGESKLEIAWKRAGTAGVPAEAMASGLEDPKVCLFIAFCRELQLLSGDEPFFLSPYSAMRFFEQRSHSTAAKWLGGLCQDGILTRVEEGSFAKRRAASYRYNFKKP